ncbi:MAG: hypothetical protein NVSMB13_02580 [Mycobacteriales bacterium]
MAELMVSRRSALSALGLLAGGGLVGFVAARLGAPAASASPLAAANGYGPPPTRGGRRLVAADAVPSGGGVVAAGVVVTRDAGGALHAFSATCTHQGCTVTGVSGGAIVCPCHGSRFDASTGAVLEGPATRPLPAVAVTVRGNDVLAG